MNTGFGKVGQLIIISGVLSVVFSLLITLLVRKRILKVFYEKSSKLKIIMANLIFITLSTIILSIGINAVLVIQVLRFADQLNYILGFSVVIILFLIAAIIRRIVIGNLVEGRSLKIKILINLLYFFLFFCAIVIIVMIFSFLGFLHYVYFTNSGY